MKVFTAVVTKLTKWLLRVIYIFIAAFMVAGLFSNWRYFPSVDFLSVVRFWPQILMWSVFAGIFHLLPSGLLALFIVQFIKFDLDRLTDIIFAVSMLVVPALLDLVPSEGFSFGVSEGELIHNGVRTSLGWHAYWMSNLQSFLQMLLYLSLRNLPFLRLMSSVKMVF